MNLCPGHLFPWVVLPMLASRTAWHGTARRRRGSSNPTKRRERKELSHADRSWALVLGLYPQTVQLEVPISSLQLVTSPFGPRLSFL